MSIITDEDLRRSVLLAPATEYRVSPIFPVVPGEGRTPDRGDEYFIGFFCSESPFPLIGRLLGEVPRENQQGLWFSHGLASLVLFAPTRASIDTIQRKHEQELRAFELWHVVRGEACSEQCWLSSPEPIPEDLPKLHAYSDLPPEQVLILDELSTAFNVAIEKSAQYMPSKLASLATLIAPVNDIITELLFLSNPDLPSPVAFSAHAAGELKSNPEQRQRLIHQRTGELVQIAASVSAANTQAFSGAFPIMGSSPCPVGTHSLLGIGCAHSALSTFSAFVERVFQKYPIAKTIRDRYGTLPPVDVFPYLRKYEPSSWTEDIVKQVDYYLSADMPPEKGKFNTVYYSLRIGFRESTFSTTAALQTIFFCDDARWSLMTLSHEILHAHVSDLLAAILYDKDRNLPEESYRKYVQRFREDLQSSPSQEPRHLIDSLRSMILQYIHLYPSFAKVGDEAAVLRKVGQTHGEAQAALRAPDDMILENFNAVFHEINEILVHVLDYHYFYDCNDDLYLGLLWESWGPVPKVLSDIEQYIYRSLVAIASGAEKAGLSFTDRFNNVVAKFDRVLRDILAKNPANIIASTALGRLKDGAATDRLLSRFHLGAYLADMARAFLWSKHVHGELYADVNCSKDAGVYLYSVDTGEFRDMVVRSPVALIADRLRGSLAAEDSQLTPEHRAAWLLLACAGSNLQEGG